MVELYTFLRIDAKMIFHISYFQFCVWILEAYQILTEITSLGLGLW